jgi:hypothetical protein
MSKYRLIKCEIKTPDSLIKALNDVGCAYTRSQDLRKNEAKLDTNWTRWGGKSQEVAIAIQRNHLANATGTSSVMDGIGFAWNGNGYDLIQDKHDVSNLKVTEFLNKLNQRYSYHEAMRLARMNGYTVKSSTSENGKIRVVLQKVG